MTRRTLTSDRPRASEGPSDPAPVSEAEAGSPDFGSWLARDLRPKGTPSQIPIVERPSQPQSSRSPAPVEPELAGWLLRDLRPRSSAPPPSPARREAVPPVSSGSPAAGLLTLDSLPPAESLLPPDSLMPHAVSEAPQAMALRQDALLDDEDLAVLPSSRGRGGSSRRRRQAVLLALLLFGAVGLSFWRGRGSQGNPTASVAPAAPSGMVVAAPLPPPPPPVQDEDSDEEEALPPTKVGQHHTGGSTEPAVEPASPELPGRRGRRAGDSVARFADLPSPTLSKLARDERQKEHARDATARSQKASSGARP